MDPEGIDDDGTGGVTVSSDLARPTASEALRTRRFWHVRLVTFLDVSAWTVLLSVASNVTREITGASAALAASIVGAIGVSDGAGRCFWSAVSDYLGRTTTYGRFFGVQTPAFALPPNVAGVWLFAGPTVPIVTCYGGGFACLPASLGDLFGTKELGAVRGYSPAAWALAGVAGPTPVSQVVERTGSHTLSFLLVAGTLVVGQAGTVALRSGIANVRSEATGDGPTPNRPPGGAAPSPVVGGTVPPARARGQNLPARREYEHGGK